MGGVVAALAEHAFEHLFIECLGWDRLRADVVVQHDGLQLELAGVAQKRGFTVFHCPAHRTVLANRPLLRDVQRQIRRSHHEHILIYSCETPRKQVWQWATAWTGGRRILHREHPFFSNDPPKRLIERIEGLTVNFQEEEQTTLPDVLHRVRTALLPESELNLFARYPSYAAQSDQLAMAVKRGEPGALQAFVEFHIPLARKSSRVLIRWFDMDPEDAEQTAMIGLMEAARRFDPDRGYQFSTYASWWLRRTCQKYGVAWGLNLGMPVHHFQFCYRLAFEESRLLAEFGPSGARTALEAQLAEAGFSPAAWRHYCLDRGMCFLSELSRGERAKIEQLDDASGPSAIDCELADLVQRGLNQLRPRQVDVLQMRYGFGQDEYSLREIGGKLGISKERVRQIQERAEEKLKRYLRRSEWADELEPNASGSIETDAVEQHQ